MKNPLRKLFNNELPIEYRNLIEIIAKNHDSMGGANRSAVAELQARSAWELNKATKGLKTATWILSITTIILGLITLFKN
jgi:hypothetical protein